MKRLLLAQARQKCPIALSVLGEMAVLDAVAPQTTAALSFTDAVERACSYYERVLDVTAPSAEPPPAVSPVQTRVQRGHMHRHAAWMLGALRFAGDATLDSAPAFSTSDPSSTQPTEGSPSIEYVRYAASRGSGDALLLLGYLHYVGSATHGVSLAPTSARAALDEAAGLGHNGARLFLAQRHRFGDRFLPGCADPDVSLARQYLQPTLNAQDGWGLFLAGDDAGGITTPASFVQTNMGGASPQRALAWYLRCVGNGGSRSRDDVADQMDTSRLATAEASRLYLFDDTEWAYRDEDLIASYDAASVRVNEYAPPLQYDGGRRLLHQLVAGDSRGQSRALLRAGIHLHEGFGVDKDPERAQDLWSMALDLDPWNVHVMDVLRRTGSSTVRQLMAMRQNFVLKDAAQRPFPAHWGHHLRGVPTVLSSDEDADAFLARTHGGTVGFILATTGWATMAHKEEHAAHDRRGAAALARQIERYVHDEEVALADGRTEDGHPCLFAAVDVSTYPSFLEKQGYTVDQCPTVIVVFDGRVHSQYNGLPDAQFETFYKTLKQDAPKVNDMCGFVRLAVG